MSAVLKQRAMETRGAHVTAMGALSALTLAVLVAACGGGGGGGGCNGLCSTSPPTATPSHNPPPLVGCNAGATSIMAGAQEPLARRVPARGAKAPFIAGLIAVKFSGSGTEPEVAQALARIRAKLESPRSGHGYATYKIPDGSSPPAAAASLAGTRGIAEARPIPARYLQVIPSDQEFGPAPPYTAPYTTPPHATQVQWDMYYTQMPAAWDITLGLPSVRIAVIDSGYDANNLDICSKVVDSAVFDLGNGGQDAASTAQDDDGHGSNVSGIAASVTNNANRYAGVGWNVDLLEVRVFQNPTQGNPNPGGASSQDIAAAIDWAVAHGAKVINMSLGSPPGTPCDSGEQTAINAATGANVAVVVASGNNGSNVLGDPANCAGVIAAGASAIDETIPTNPTEKVAGYSSFAGNKTWGVVAPGGDPDMAQQTCGSAPLCDFLQWIINNYSTTACCANSMPPNAPNHGVLIAGTSMAAPHVAGVAALMASKDPGITPALVASILKSTADDLCTGCFQQGAGRINARKALNATP